MEYANKMLKTEREVSVMPCVGPTNCGIENNGVRFCNSTGCLAWRFAKGGFWENHTGQRYKTHVAPGHGDRGHWVELGFCGVIGDPQTST